MKRWKENEAQPPTARAVVKRPVNNMEHKMKRPFHMSWSQRGHDIYIIFTRTSPAIDLSFFDVALTDRSCTIRSPGSEKHGWNFFMEVIAKDAQRIQSGDRLIVIVPKKDPSLYWTDLKKPVDLAESKDIKLSSVASDEPPPEKIRHQAKDLEENVKFKQHTEMVEDCAGEEATNKAVETNSSVPARTNLKATTDPTHSTLHYHLTSVNSAWRELGPDIIVFTIFVPHLDPWGTNVSFSEEHIQICFKTADETFHKQYGTTTDALFMWNVKLNKKIIPSKSTRKVTLKLMEIRLFKKDPVKWSNLTSSKASSEKMTESSDSSIEGGGLSSGDSLTPAEENTAGNVSISTSHPNSSTSALSASGSWNKPSTSKTIKFANRSSGYTGLDNVGNTCFMNSVLQALANTRELRDFFLGNLHERDLNRTNPLGMNGKMAEEVAGIMHKLWRDAPRSFAPIKFRRIVGEKEPRFVDYLQHDAQEFMAFLLDKLHEDLNRVKNKPNYEIPEVGDRVDRVVAEESWKLHTSRNNSFIVDLFHGVFKSKLYCPVCRNDSVKFDPFLFLSVPLPKVTRVIQVFFFPKDLSKTPVKVSINVSKQYGKAIEVYNQVSSLFKCPVQSLRMFEVYKNRIHRFFVYDSTLEKISSTDTIFVQETISSDDVNEPVYELAVQQQQRSFPQISPFCSYCKGEPCEVKIKRCTKCLRNGYCNQECQKADWPQHRKVCQRTPDLVGYPFLVSVPQSKATCSYVKNLLWQLSSRWMEMQFFDKDEPAEPPEELGSLLRMVAINWNGSIKAGLPNLEDFGDSLLDLSHYKLLSLHWETDARLDRYLQVNTKPLDYSSHDVSSRSEAVDLYNCIRLFTEPEVLAPQEAWYCPTCKEHQEATKEMSLWQLPDILIVQLKRFSFKNLLWRDKIDMFVDFPVDGLDMSRYCPNKPDDAPLIYDLFAVVNHYGGIYGGHYTSFVRLPSTEDSTKSTVGWRVCDDSHVMDISAEHVVTKAAYVMFYKKRKVLTSHPDQPPSKFLSMKLTQDEDQEEDLLSEDRPGVVRRARTSTTSLASKQDNGVPQTTTSSHVVEYLVRHTPTGKNHFSFPTSSDNQFRSLSSSELDKPLSPFTRQMALMDDTSSQDISVGCIIEEPLLKYDEIFACGEALDAAISSESDDAPGPSSKSISYLVNSPSTDFESLKLRDANSTDGDSPYTDMDAVD